MLRSLTPVHPAAALLLTALSCDVVAGLTPADAPAPVAADSVLYITGGHWFDVEGQVMRPNRGIVVRGGRILSVAGAAAPADTAGARHVRLAADEYLLPGFFDLHAHYAMDLFGAGRWDDTDVYPVLFLANGVTSTFPAGEMQPERMREMRLRIDRGEQPGPRVYNSGPYYGTARPGWSQGITADSIRAEVAYWVAQGARGFKAKGIRPEHLAPLIQAAHEHGVTVTGHLDSGFRNSVNPRDAIRMGIDRIEHFLGGDYLTAERSAYASLVSFSPTAPGFRDIAQLYIDHGVFYNATLSAYGYYGMREPAVFTYFTDEKRFLTPYMREIVEARPPRPVNEQFEQIYHVKRATIRAFHDMGGARNITLGTDHPSWGEYLSPFSVHRELKAFVLAGIPPASALRIATLNGARALGVGDVLGAIAAGRFADMLVVQGNPLDDIDNTRNVRSVIKAGTVYDPAALLQSVEGRLGPRNAEEARTWGWRPDVGR
jgi:imidazolonepropionase-like amidohydrolase